jgi:hypothetical protein
LTARWRLAVFGERIGAYSGIYYHSTAGDRRSPLQTYGEVLDPGEDCRGGLRPPAGALPYLERGSAGAYNGINYRSSAGDRRSPLQTYDEVLDPGEDCRGGLRPPAGALPYLERGSAGAYNGINYRSSAGDRRSPLQTYDGVCRLTAGRRPQVSPTDSYR